MGHFDNDIPEGVRNVSLRLSCEMGKHHEVLTIDVKDIPTWQRMQTFHPDIIHFVVDPSGLLIFVISKFLSAMNKSSKVVMSALHPGRIFPKELIKYLRPDLILVQSQNSEEFFRSAGCPTSLLPNGVNTRRFIPISEGLKRKLRESYGVPSDKFVVLHVGPIRSDRNISVLKKLQSERIQVIVVGRSSAPIDKELVKVLSRRGCIVWTDYFPHIENIYGLSDCYVFPTWDRFSCIEMPLSILEAMSCNLPVVTTNFGSISRFIEQDSDFRIVSSTEEVLSSTRAFVESSLVPNTRQKAQDFSWRRIAEMLEGIYRGMLS